MSLRWRIAIGFALVALATAAVVALATPSIVGQGFAELDTETGEPVTTPLLSAAPTVISEDDSGESGGAAAPVTRQPGQAQQSTTVRLILASILAAAIASLLGLLAAGRLVRPLNTLENAASGLARGDLRQRSGLADRSDEFGQLGRTFDSMAGELERAEESRRVFLQDAAHELKTPLAVIEATSSAIIDGVYQPDKRHLETIRDQSRILARIVDDLRTISLAEGGHLPLERRIVDVPEILQSVASSFEARAAAGSVKLVVDGPGSARVDADPDRLRQLLSALVDNALRHTPAGGEIGLRATLVPESQPGRAGVAAGRPQARTSVRIDVEDTGSGIPPESIGHVFERFYQADVSRSRGSGTSGLGLSIVRALVEAHGGRAGAENRPEGGARLWIELPAVVPSDVRTRQAAGRRVTIE